MLKYNRFGMKQERYLLLTTHKLCNVKKREFQREIKINNINAMSKPQDPENKEFVCHVKDEYDYRFVCENREDLFTSLKAVYFLQTNNNLPIFAVPDSLKKWTTSKKDAKEGRAIIPPKEYRLLEEDVYEPMNPNSTDNSRQSTASESDNDEEVMASYTGKATYAKGGDENVSLADFQIKKVIGRGSFGKVFLVQHKETGKVYAMKSLRKDVILDYDQVQSTKLEKDILLQADHPFLVGMSYVFMTD